MLAHYLHTQCLMLILISFSLTAQADIYKWQDEDEHTNYSQLPPENGVVVEVIPTAKPPAIDDQTSKELLDETLDQEQKQAEEEAKKQEEALRLQQKEENKQLNCEAAKINLQRYLDIAIKRFSDEDGTYLRMTPEKRAQFERRFRDDVKKYCN